METVRIYRLDGLSPSMKKWMYEAQREAARVWTLCRDLHLHARQHNLSWPTRDDLQRATKGGRWPVTPPTIQREHDRLCRPEGFVSRLPIQTPPSPQASDAVLH